MDFTCVNCSRLTAVSFTSDDLTIFRCNECDMEYSLTGRMERQSAPQNVSIRTGKMINENDEFNSMPIKVEIKRS